MIFGYVTKLGLKAFEAEVAIHPASSQTEYLTQSRPRVGTRQIDSADIVHAGTHANLRHCRPGPELDMLMAFLGEMTLAVPRGTSVKVFHQPRIENSFPDVVLVLWRPSLTRQWPEARRQLTRFDLRVLHYLATTGPTHVSAIHALFGSKCTTALSRLEAANTVSITPHTVRSKSLSQIYAVQRIVSIEAKISDWKSAISQAVLNTWFTDDSWVLMPDRIAARVSHKVALYQSVRCVPAADTTHDFSKLPQNSIPVSYASWLLNEWAWRLNLNNTH